MYLTGFSIDCLAVFTLSGYLLYHHIQKKPVQGLRAIRPIIFLIAAECIISAYFVCTGDLILASVIVWVQAVAIIVTFLFILLIIIFKPDWK